MEDPIRSPRYTLSKEERLHLTRDVDALFASGQAFIAYQLLGRRSEHIRVGWSIISRP